MNNVQKNKPLTPKQEWKRFESAIDTLLQAQPVHRTTKQENKKPTKRIKK